MLTAAVEIALGALIAGTLLSQPLRDGAALVLLVALFAKRATDAPSLPPRWVIAIALFFGSNVLAALASEEPGAAFDALRFYPLGLLVFLGTRQVTIDRAERLPFTVVLALVSLFGVDAIWQAATGTSWLGHRQAIWGRTRGALPFPSDASMLPILLPVALCALPEASLAGLGARAAAVAITTAAVSFSGTRSAWCALLVLALVWALESRRRRFAVGLLAVVLGASLATAVIAPETAPGRLFAARTYNAEKRPSQWAAAWELARLAPILGHGPHSFHREIERRQPGNPVFASVDLRYAPYPHDIYLEALAGAGVLGLLSLCWLIGLGAAAGWRAYRSHANGRAALLALAVFASVGLFDLSLVKDWVQLCFWLPMGIAAGLDGDPRTVTSVGDGEGSADRPPRR